MLLRVIFSLNKGNDIKMGLFIEMV